MGNVCQSSQVRLRSEFQQCSARSWGAKDLRCALEQVETIGAPKGGAAFSSLRLQHYTSVFEHDETQAQRQFRLLCERASVSDMARAKPKCSGLTALTTFCFLACATPYIAKQLTWKPWPKSRLSLLAGVHTTVI
jgi:hypothetical protein